MAVPPRHQVGGHADVERTALGLAMASRSRAPVGGRSRCRLEDVGDGWRSLLLGAPPSSPR